MAQRWKIDQKSQFQSGSGAVGGRHGMCSNPTQPLTSGGEHTTLARGNIYDNRNVQRFGAETGPDPKPLDISIIINIHLHLGRAVSTQNQRVGRVPAQPVGPPPTHWCHSWTRILRFFRPFRHRRSQGLSGYLLGGLLKHFVGGCAACSSSPPNLITNVYATSPPGTRHAPPY